MKKGLGFQVSKQLDSAILHCEKAGDFFSWRKQHTQQGTETTRASNFRRTRTEQKLQTKAETAALVN